MVWEPVVCVRRVKGERSREESVEVEETRLILWRESFTCAWKISGLVKWS